MPDIDWQEASTAAGVASDASRDVDRLLSVGSPGRADIADLARVLLYIDTALEALSESRAEVHHWLSEIMESNDQHVPGVGDLHRDWSKPRKAWSNERLLADALQASRAGVPGHAVDPSTGEMVHTWDQAVTALSALYNLAGYSARIGAIRAAGLEPSDYCIEGEWQPKISVTPEKEGASDGD